MKQTYKYSKRFIKYHKLDGVGPVDNTSSTNKLHHFVKTRDMWHVTRDKWHLICDILWGVNTLSKFKLPSSSGLWFMIFYRLGGKGSLTDWMNEFKWGGWLYNSPGYTRSVKNRTHLKSLNYKCANIIILSIFYSIVKPKICKFFSISKDVK